MNKENTDNTLFDNNPFTLDKLDGKGGAFLVIPCCKGEVFSREKFSEEHKMFEQAALDFAKNEISGFFVEPISRCRNVFCCATCFPDRWRSRRSPKTKQGLYSKK